MFTGSRRARRNARDAATNSPLSIDPMVESVQLRQRVAVLASWRGFLFALILLTAAILWLVLWPSTRVEAGIATSLATGWAGIQLDRLSEARHGRDDFYRDVITLSSVFYQSPATIRDFLGQESIERSIANLLKAALRSDELGTAYWQQSVRPFIAFRDHGFKEDWCYSIDLRDLDSPLDVELLQGQRVRFDPAEYRRLTTALTYSQTALEPADFYWVACAFDPNTIPAWFREPHFLLREILSLPEEARKSLREALPSFPISLEGRRKQDHSDAVEQDRLRHIAREIFDASVRIGGVPLGSEQVFATDEGICWGFELTDAQRETLRSSLEIRVEVKTLQSRALNYFPVAINTPTRHPMIRFNYGMCQSIGAVESEIFFSAERPYDDELRVVSTENRRIEIQTRPVDWVLGGSGCVFVWEDSLVG